MRKLIELREDGQKGPIANIYHQVPGALLTEDEIKTFLKRTRFDAHSGDPLPEPAPGSVQTNQNFPIMDLRRDFTPPGVKPTEVNEEVLQIWVKDAESKGISTNSFGHLVPEKR